MDILRRSPLFHGLDENDLSELLAGKERRKFFAEDIIIEENAPGDFMYVIIEGRVEIAKTLEALGRTVIHACGPGDSFGEMSILEEKPRSAEARALELTEVILFSKEELKRLILRFPRIAINLLQTTSNRLRETNEKLIHALEERARKLETENIRLVEEITRAYPRHLTSRNPCMQEVIRTAKKAAATTVTILLLGESGTGKEVFARAIHEWSDRRKEPFIPVNCAALPSQLLESELFGHEKGAFTGATQTRKGKFELAHGGTIFLDEIGDMAEETQAKVLRVLQEQEFQRVGGAQTIKVDVRIIAATNHDLEKAIEEGSFREDLYYRLNVVTIKLPRLRERREDIFDLADYLLKRFSRELKKPMRGFSDEVLYAFSTYSWPGNIRELSNVIERAVALSESDMVTLEDLPSSIYRKEGGAPAPPPAAQEAGPGAVAPITYQDAIEGAKMEAIRAALEATGGNQSRAAQILGIERSYLSRLMKQYGMR